MNTSSDNFMKLNKRTRYWLPRIFTIVLMVLISFLGIRTTAHAAGHDLYVDPSGTDGSNDCLNSSAPCKTIGYAISKTSGGEVIHIAAGTYYENLSINRTLTLQGAGMSNTVIDGNATNRVIDCSGVSTTLEFYDLTIQNGLVAGEGGGIRGYCGTIYADRIKISGNHATDGGGYFGYSYLYLTDSIVSDNHADQDGSDSWGGGLFLTGNPETKLTRVTISNNSALGYIGGIHSQAGSGSYVYLTNVTMTGNTGAQIGAMDNTASTMMWILNSTIAFNTATGDGAVGGIRNYSQIEIQNSIVANNGSLNCGSSSGLTSMGNNIDSGSTCGFTNLGDMQNLDPLLNVLEDNGGYTPTMSLQEGSLAQDGANDSVCPPTDQRGVTRPQGDACDIGAFEKETKPGNFTLLAPVNNAIKRPPNLTLKWNPSNGATEYFYCLKKQGGSCSWMSVGALTSIPITGLSPATTYVWEVFAQNPVNLTYANGGMWWSFTTLPMPGAFNKTSPVNGSVNKPTTLTLYWRASSNATRYEYCLKKSLSAACTWKSTGLLKKVTLTGLSKNTKYYWQVRAKNAMGTTPANGGTFWSFKTKP